MVYLQYSTGHGNMSNKLHSSCMAKEPNVAPTFPGMPACYTVLEFAGILHTHMCSNHAKSKFYTLIQCKDSDFNSNNTSVDSPSMREGGTFFRTQKSMI